MQPHPQFAHFFQQLGGAGAGLLGPWVGTVARATLPRWASSPYRFTGTGSILSGGRWNVRNLMPAIYFSTTAETMSAEADAEAIRQGWPPGAMRPQTRFWVQVTLQAVLDLTAPATLAALGVQTADLTGCDWQAEQAADREPLTQAVARAVFERLGEGLAVPSAQQPGGINVIVFPVHLRPASQLVTQHAAQIPFVHGLA